MEDLAQPPQHRPSRVAPVSRDTGTLFTNMAKYSVAPDLRRHGRRPAPCCVSSQRLVRRVVPDRACRSWRTPSRGPGCRGRTTSASVPSTPRTGSAALYAVPLRPLRHPRSSCTVARADDAVRLRAAGPAAERDRVRVHAEVLQELPLLAQPGVRRAGPFADRDQARQRAGVQVVAHLQRHRRDASAQRRRLERRHLRQLRVVAARRQVGPPGRSTADVAAHAVPPQRLDEQRPGEQRRLRRPGRCGPTGLPAGRHPPADGELVRPDRLRSRPCASTSRSPVDTSGVHLEGRRLRPGA